MSRNKIQQGFTLIELLIVVTIIGILAAIAIPSYNSSVIKGSRAAAQTDLMQMAALQEKIYLNSNSYSTTANIITDAYDGKATGGLGWSAKSKDGKYTYRCQNCTSSVYTIEATPSGVQAGDGTLSINSTGQRLWTGGSSATW